MLKKFSLLAGIMLVSACQTTPTTPPAQQGTSQSTPAVQEPAPQVATTAQIEAQEPITYTDSWTFDWDLSQALRATDDEMVLLTPENVTLNEIPESLDKWLSRIKDKGGKVNAKAIPKEGDLQTRSILGALLDVVLYLVGVLKEEATFGAIDDFDAILNYDKETGKVESITLYRRS